MDVDHQGSALGHQGESPSPYPDLDSSFGRSVNGAGSAGRQALPTPVSLVPPSIDVPSPPHRASSGVRGLHVGGLLGAGGVDALQRQLTGALGTGVRAAMHKSRARRLRRNYQATAAAVAADLQLMSGVHSGKGFGSAEGSSTPSLRTDSSCGSRPASLRPPRIDISDRDKSPKKAGGHRGRQLTPLGASKSKQRRQSVAQISIGLPVQKVPRKLQKQRSDDDHLVPSLGKASLQSAKAAPRGRAVMSGDEDSSSLGASGPELVSTNAMKERSRPTPGEGKMGPRKQAS